MIPDFKTYIGESVWADIHKRSNGSQGRKEDDLNLLDIDGLFSYVQEKYSDRVCKIDSEEFRGFQGWKNCVVFPFDNDLEITITRFLDTGKIRNIVIMWDKNGVRDSFRRKLKDRFNMRLSPRLYIDIKDKNGSVSNQTYIDLLDFVLENGHDNVLIESVWADIHRRSDGIQKRKEDNINKLDFNDFFEYLKDIYVHIKPSSFWEIGKYEEPGMQGEVQTISFPVEPTAMGSILIKKNIKKNYFYPTIVMNHKFLEQYETDLDNTFYLTKDTAEMSGYIINKDTCEIFPHDMHITNEICIDVIDKILGIVENPVFKKVE